MKQNSMLLSGIIFAGLTSISLPLGGPSFTGTHVPYPEWLAATCFFITPIFIFLSACCFIAHLLRKHQSAEIIDKNSPKYMELLVKYRQSPTDELEKIWATRAHAKYTNRTYEIVKLVLKERGSENVPNQGLQPTAHTTRRG
jgi:hypothetical protein